MQGGRKPPPAAFFACGAVGACVIPRWRGRVGGGGPSRRRAEALVPCFAPESIKNPLVFVRHKRGFPAKGPVCRQLQEQGRPQKPRKKTPARFYCVEIGAFFLAIFLKLLDIRKQKEYTVLNSLGGKAMLNRIDRFNNSVVMQSAVPAYYWQNNGLTLLYPFSSN